MTRARKSSRPVGRRLSHRTGRVPHRTNRRNLPGYERGPDDLSQAVAAFNRFLRGNRRLAKLAPRFFDPVVVDREARERQEQRRCRAIRGPALAKVYGVPFDSARLTDTLADPPPLPGPRTQCVIEREMAERDFWLAAGAIALQRYRERRPHAVPSWSQLTRLLWVGVQLGRWASGMSDKPPESSLPKTDVEADLRRAYGARDSATVPTASAPGAPNSSSTHSHIQPQGGASVPASQVFAVANPASSNSSSPVDPANEVKPETRNLQPETLSPSSPASARRDAWSSWARQMRRRPT